MIIVAVLIGMIIICTIAKVAANHDKNRLKDDIAYTVILEEKPQTETEWFANSRIYVNHNGKIGTSFSPQVRFVGAMVKFRVQYKNGHSAEYWTVKGDEEYNRYIAKVIEIK